MSQIKRVASVSRFEEARAAPDLHQSPAFRHLQGKSAILDEATVDFVSIVDRLLAYGLSMKDIADVLREQADMLERIAAVTIAARDEVNS